MKAFIKKTFANKFLSATLWVFLGTGFMNFGSYVYHLLMGRMLGVSLYGALESVISLLYILFVPTLALSLVVVKFVSEYKGKGEKTLMSDLYNYAFSKLVLLGVATSVLVILLTPILKSFLHLSSNFLIPILALTFLLNLVYTLNKSVVQGTSSFFKFGILNFLETAGKLVFAVVLVWLGFKVEGAFAATGIGLLLGFVLSISFIRGIIKTKFDISAKFSKQKNLLKFAIPTFITTLALMSLFTTDIVLVRHFFSGTESGYYSALSVLGKIVYYGASPIVFVVFPMVSESHARGDRYQKFLIGGFAITLAICSAITIIYFTASNLMVNLLFGPKFSPIAPLLGLFAVFISIYALGSLLANFYLSIHKTTSSIIVAVAAIAQIILINFFHANLSQVIWVSIIVTFLLLISLLLYYPHAKSG